MIPLVYRLRDHVRVSDEGGRWRVVCELPLTVLEINGAAARLLLEMVDGASVGRLAEAAALSDEKVLRLCEYFRGKGLVDVALDPAVAPEPRVSVIVPVRDRAHELSSCLATLSALDYPAGRLEVIVVDDGSVDDTPAVAAHSGCRVIANELSRGPAQCRNRGANDASGDLLAFIDSDCAADPGWLRELVPYFAWPRVAVVGGSVEGRSTRSRLDRYEAAASSLSMGRHLQISLDGAGGLYVPSCNLLVRRDLYLSVGGMREDLRFGEDVDLCWRLRDRGHALVYAPHGVVRHTHRDSLRSMLGQRVRYGSSEAALHLLHPEKRKQLPLPPLPTLTFGALTLVLVTREPLLGPIVLLPWTADAARRWLHLRREGIGVAARRVGSSVLRGHLSLVYYVCFHLVRYYLIVLVVAGVAWPGIRAWTAFAVVYTCAVDYSVQRPQLEFPAFLVFRILEHCAYQMGVVAGCLRQRSFRPYRLAFRQAPAVGG